MGGVVFTLHPRVLGAPALEVGAADAALRASVLSRAGVGVLRAVRLAYGRVPEADRAAAVDAAELVRTAFACLE